MSRNKPTIAPLESTPMSAFLEQKKTVAHSMTKSPNSVLSTNCRMAATRMMKKKNSQWLLQQFNVSNQFLNQFNENLLHVLRVVGLVFVELVLEDEFLCYHILQLLHILCTTCHKSPLLLGSHRADPLVHLHSQSSRRASTSSSFCFVPILSQRKNGPLLRSRRWQYKCSHPTQF